MSGFGTLCANAHYRASLFNWHFSNAYFSSAVLFIIYLPIDQNCLSYLTALIAVWLLHSSAVILQYDCYGQANSVSTRCLFKSFSGIRITLSLCVSTVDAIDDADKD